MLKRGLVKRAQVTIFIIFGILIVISIIALFLLLPEPEVSISPRKDPQGFVQNCVELKLSSVISKIQEQGGYYFPANYLLYEEIKASYLCYTDSDNELCLRNEGLFKERIEEEIRFNSANYVEACFDELIRGSKGLDIEVGLTDYSVEIVPGRILVKINKEVTVGKGENEQRYSKFDFSIPSSFFDFIMISNEILNEEVSCNCGRESCTADTTELMESNRDYSISFFISSSNQKVYSIEQRITKERFNFALRNCVRSL